MGYFYGFKLHLVVNDQGQILAFCLTPGNVDANVSPHNPSDRCAENAPTDVLRQALPYFGSGINLKL